MKVVSSSRGMQSVAQQWKREGVKVGFVPTMGYLHEGHISLVRRAREEVGADGQIVVSIFVNPTQFAAHEDLSRYPRDLARDKKLCSEAGVNLLFIPKNGEMYLEGHSAYVVEEAVSMGMEGVSRPTHFRGVATVVAKLFNLVLPDVTIFGAKDFQQAALVKRIVRDLNFPVKIVVAPTVRESDGLAMSSRNKYLSKAQREQASALWLAITEARRLVSGRAVSASALKAELRKQIEKNPEARVDYIEVFDPNTLVAVEKAEKGQQLAMAVFVGKTRLIDNAQL